MSHHTGCVLCFPRLWGATLKVEGRGRRQGNSVEGRKLMPRPLLIYLTCFPGESRLPFLSWTSLFWASFFCSKRHTGHTGGTEPYFPGPIESGMGQRRKPSLTWSISSCSLSASSSVSSLICGPKVSALASLASLAARSAFS